MVELTGDVWRTKSRSLHAGQRRRSQHLSASESSHVCRRTSARIMSEYAAGRNDKLSFGVQALQVFPAPIIQGGPRVLTFSLLVGLHKCCEQYRTWKVQMICLPEGSRGCDTLPAPILCMRQCVEPEDTPHTLPTVSSLQVNTLGFKDPSFTPCISSDGTCQRYEDTRS